MAETSERRGLPEWIAAAALVLLALVLRLVYVWQVKDTPLVQPDELDPGFYFNWAKEIAGGAWLGTAPFVQSPLYAYLLALWMKVAGGGVGRILVAQALVGCGTVLLTYLLGRRILGHARGLLAGLLVALYGPFIFYEGMVMKTFLSPFLTILLLWLLDRAGGRSEAAVEGAAGSLPASSQRLVFALCGIVFGLLTLDRDNFILLAPVLAALAYAIAGGWIGAPGSGSAAGEIAASGHGARGRGFRAAAAFTLGTVLVIAPVTLRNWAVSKELVLLTTGGGEVFFIGNNADANGLYAPPPFVRPDPKYEHADFIQRAGEISGRTLSPMQSSWFWFREGAKFIVSEPLAWIGLLWTKFIHFWNAYELPDNLDYVILQWFSPLLHALNPTFPPPQYPTLSIPGGAAWLPVRLHFFSTFGTVAPLGLLGIYLSRRQWRRLLPLYVLLFGYMGTVLLFFNFSRFRVPVVPILAIFAGESLIVLGRVLRKQWDLAVAFAGRSGEMVEKARALRPDRGQAIAAALLVIFLVGVNVEFPRGVVPAIEQCVVLGNAYYGQGDAERARQAYYRGLVLLGEGPAGPAGDELLRREFGAGLTRAALQKEVEAEAVAKGPQFKGIHIGIHHGLAIAWVMEAQTRIDKGDRAGAMPLLDRAIAQFNEALKIAPAYLLSHRKMARAYALKGDTPTALDWLKKAADLWPEDLQTRLDLAEMLYDSGDFPAALRNLDLAIAYNRSMDDARLAEVHFYRGLIYLNGLDEPGKALFNLERAIELQPVNPQAAEINRTILQLRSKGYQPLRDESFDRPAPGGQSPPGAQVPPRSTPQPRQPPAPRPAPASGA